MHATAELDDRPGPVRDALVSHQQEWLKALGKAVQLTIDEGHFKPDVDPSLFAFQLYGIVLSYYHSARLFRDPAAKSNATRAFESLMSAAAVTK
jgi:hypothetical protein